MATLPIIPRREIHEGRDQVAAAVLPFAPQGSTVVPEWRSWRWVVHLGDDIAFVAEDDGGWARLEREGALLARVQRRGGLAAPEVITHDAAARLQVRRKVPGLSGFALEDVVFGRPGKLNGPERYADSLVITPQGERLAAEIGRAILGLQHTMSVEEARALGFPDTDTGDLLDRVAAYLQRRSELAPLLRAVPALRAWFAELPADPVLAHRDVQMHNVAVDPASGALRALFDFDDAAVAHRLEDFKYLPSMGKRFTELALEAYAATGGPRLHLADVWRFHVMSALEHFLFVAEGTPRWHEIVAWSGEALAHQPL